jgi:hypothetical protein
VAHGIMVTDAGRLATDIVGWSMSVPAETTVGETYAITFHVKPAVIGRILSLLDAVLDTMPHEATFFSASLNLDPDRPNVFQLHET